MATVRTAEEEQKKIIIGIGYGAREHIAAIKAFAEKINAGYSRNAQNGGQRLSAL